MEKTVPFIESKWNMKPLQEINNNEECGGGEIPN